MELIETVKVFIVQPPCHFRGQGRANETVKMQQKNCTDKLDILIRQEMSLNLQVGLPGVPECHKPI
jgi:hypothetical protein